MNTMNPGGKERPTRVHHLNCGSMMSIEATYEGPPPLHAVCHCLLVETDRDGLVLIETGLGLDDVRRPQDSLDPEWVELARPELRPAETARQQIERLGYAASDVRHIALTHLDVDHCGGLPDFPEAQVHLMASELGAAMAEAPSFRYRPAHWAHGPRWVTYEPDSAGGEEWAGFAGVRPLTGVASEVLMMPLGGHSAGHAGFAVRDGEGWLLHAGDAYFYHREIAADDPHSHPLMDLIQLNAQVDEELRIANQGRLREAAAGGAGEERIRVINAHDPWDFRSLGGA
ncbi:MBL fold metallo-hydrolase [Streptomyces decoyicus]|uniref:MBL fold metallo-hydrolase n=1 Tax=Streptomyces decoyicus TaxID=249567 RepID=UPI002E2F2669|nr:MBL fold metallo-hydrolase [Streptomyces decoyicus]